MHYHQIDTFRCQQIKDEQDTKEDTGKSMKNALYMKTSVSQSLENSV